MTSLFSVHEKNLLGIVSLFFFVMFYVIHVQYTSYFLVATPPYPGDRTASNNSPSRAHRAGLVPGVA